MDKCLLPHTLGPILSPFSYEGAVGPENDLEGNVLIRGRHGRDPDEGKGLCLTS